MARIGRRNRAGSLGWWWAAVGSATVMLVAIVLWMRRPTPEADVTALSAWRSPTQSLLRPPVIAAWNRMPQLGEEIFKINPIGEIHAK